MTGDPAASVPPTPPPTADDAGATRDMPRSGQTPTATGIRGPAAFGRYQLLRPLGEGGMGAVFLAHDPALDRPVALKMPHLADAPARQRFLTEARAAAALQHPNICPVFDVGEVDGRPFLAMAYIDGPTLAARLKEGPLPPAEAVAVARALAAALGAAHAAGVVHRDMKPANVLLAPDGRPVVTDFGLARRDGDDAGRLTRTGQTLGTPAYMPPEQVNGDHAAVGPASDVYSLGAVLYEMLAGRPPFSGRSAFEICAQVVGRAPAPPSRHRPGVPAALDRACLRALAKRPGDRFPTMAAFAAALPDAPAAGREPRPRAGAVFAALGLAVAGFALAVALAWNRPRPADTTPPAPEPLAVEGPPAPVVGPGPTPKPVVPPPPPPPPPPRVVTRAEELGAMVEALRRNAHAGRTRFFMLTNLAGEPAAVLDDHRAALAAAVNLLSDRGPPPAVPVRPLGEGLLVAVDLDDPGWDAAGLWPRWLRDYPYGLKHDRDRDPAARQLARDLYDLAGTDLPAVRADWFISEVAGPKALDGGGLPPAFAGVLAELTGGRDVAGLVRAVRARYRADVTQARAAAELGVKAADVAAAVRRDGLLRETGLGPLADGGSVPRGRWADPAGLVSPFQELATALDAGTPKRVR